MTRSLSAFGLLIAMLVARPVAAQEGALASLRAAAQSAPRDYDAQVALGRALIEAGHYREASTTLRRAAGLRRGDAQAQFELARVDFARREYQAARQQCRAVQRLARGSAIAHVCMARAWIAWNRSARAMEELEAATQVAPDDYEVLLAPGDAHRLQHAVSEAEAAYQRAARVNAQAAEPHYGLGLLYAQSNRRDDAIRELRRAHQLDGDDPDIDFELGQLLSGAEAVEHLRDAVSNRPGWALAQAALGDGLMANGDTTGAIQAFEQAIQSDSHLAHARAGLGRALTEAGNLERAESTLVDALGQVPNDFESTLALADIFARTERSSEALEQYQHAADLDPQNPEPLIRAARLALGQERPVLALGFLQRAIAARPNAAAALVLMGDIMRGRRQNQEAREYYERALRGEGQIDRAAVQRTLRGLR